jgi:replicative DNA helicase
MDEYDRAIITYNKVIEHKAWCAARKRGVPTEKRPGTPFTNEQSDLAINLAEEIRCWPGRLWFVEKMAIKVDELLTRLGEIIAGCESKGERISFVVVDYAQLLRSGGNASESIDRALSEFKSFCVDNDLVGVVASQVPKEAGKEQASGSAKLTQHTLQNARADYFNLVLTINRQLNDAGERTPMATIRIAKNSLGKTGEAQLYLNEERLMWFDVTKKEVQL